MNIFIEYRKVLNTVPTLGGVKSAFHEAKQESIINYETDNNSPHTRQVMNIVNFFMYTKNIKKRTILESNCSFQRRKKATNYFFQQIIHCPYSWWSYVMWSFKRLFLMYDSFHQRLMEK